MNTTDEQIKTVETIRDETFPHGERGEHAALTALLTELREMREMLEAADAIQFENLRFVRGTGYCWISNEGDETVSLLDAYKLYRDVKKHE